MSRAGIYSVRDDLKSRIWDRGLSIASVARAAGFSYACVSGVLNGRAGASHEVMKAIAAVLDEKVEALFPHVSLEASRAAGRRTKGHTTEEHERCTSAGRPTRHRREAEAPITARLRHLKPDDSSTVEDAETDADDTSES